MRMRKNLLLFFFSVMACVAGAQTTRTYTDKLVVTIDGVSSEPMDATIVLEDLGDGTCNVSLQNFALVSGEDAIPVGNINVKGMALTDAGAYKAIAADQVIQITPGEPADAGWIGPMLGDVPIKLTGKLTDEKLYCTIDIDMSETLGQVIAVVFGSDLEGGDTPVSGKVYTDKLVVTIDGVSSEPMDATIVLEDLGDGTCNVSLQNFALVSGEDAIPVGNINVKGMALTDAGAYKAIAADQVIQITPGEPADAGWIGPMLGDVPIKLTGKLTDEKLYCTIDIDMSETLGQVIAVVFGSDMTTGIRPVAQTAGRVDVYTLNGVCVRRGVAEASALNGLQRGVYVVNGKKIIK